MGIFYYRTNTCKLPIHISQRVLKLYKESNYDFYGANYEALDLDNTLKHHLHIHPDEENLDIHYLLTPHKNDIFPEQLTFNMQQYNYYSSVKYDILNVSEKRIGELRNFSFKLHNNLEKYMIYLEISRFNTELNEINNKKIHFLEYYLKIIDHKLKFLICYFKKLIPLSTEKYTKMLQTVKPMFKKIPENFEDLDKITENYVRFSKPPEILKLLKEKREINFLVMDKKSQEETIKMDNSVIIESFIHLIHNLFEIFRRETKINLLKRSINSIRMENLALVNLT